MSAETPDSKKEKKKKVPTEEIAQAAVDALNAGVRENEEKKRNDADDANKSN